jgi:hypothetical protein
MSTALVLVGSDQLGAGASDREMARSFGGQKMPGAGTIFFIASSASLVAAHRSHRCAAGVENIQPIPSEVSTTLVIDSTRRSKR